MRRRSTANQQAAGVSLFPFLAVLLCTMGALIVVLVVIARQARIQVAEATSREAATSATSELVAQGEQLQWRISELKKSREDTQKILNDKQAELSHLEDHTRRLRDQLEELEEARVHFSELAAGDSKETEELKKRLARLRIDADRTKREIDDLRRNAGGTGESYAIIPYHGPSETHRRPIYIECRKDSLVLQPEGIVLSEYDFTVDLGPSNPLAGALRAAKEYHLRNQLSGKGDGGTPYPLFLVRPDGIMMWYVGRAAIASWGSEFGYELVGADWKFEFPPVEKMLKLSMNQAVEEGRVRQQYLARAAPAMRHGGGGTFRAARGGGLVQVDGAPVGRGGGRRGFGRPGGVLGRRNGGRDAQGGGTSGGGLVNNSAGPTTEGPIHSIDGDDNPYLSALGPDGAGGNASQPSGGGATGSLAGNSVSSGGAAPGGVGSGGPGGSATVLAGGPNTPGSPGGSGWRNGGNAGGSPFSDPTAPALGKGGNGRLPGTGGNGSGPFGAGAGGAGSGNGRSPNQLAMGGGQGPGMYPGSTGGILPGGIGQSGSGTTGNRYSGQGGNGAMGNGSSGNGSSGNGQAAGLGNGQGTGTSGGTNNGLFLGNKGGPGAVQKTGGTLAGSANGVAGGGPAGTGTAANGGPVLGTAANGTPASGTTGTSATGTAAMGTAAMGTAYRGQRAGGGRASSTTNSGPGTSDLANSDPNSTSSGAGSSIAASPNGYAGATVVDNGQASGDSSAASSRYAGTAGSATSGSLTGVDSGGSPGGNSSRGGTGGNSASPSRAGRSNSNTGNPNTNFSSSQVSSYNSGSSNSGSSSGQQSPFGGSASASSSMSSPMMGGMPSPSMNFGQQAQAEEKKPHRRRERNWANPDASTMNVPLERTIRVVCDADHLTLLPEGRGKQAMRIIPFKGQTYESVDELVGAVWDRIESWGTAGRGMYWRPKLQMEIEPGGQRRYTELQTLLADSGFDVHGKPKRRILGDRRLGKLGN